MVYLYLALFAKAGHLSTRIFFDDAEQLVRLILHPNLHVEKFAQYFTLGKSS